MIDKMVFSRSFRRSNQKTFLCGALIGCLIIVVTLSTVIKSYMDPLHMYFEVNSIDPVIYNMSNSRSDVYDIHGDVRIKGSSSTILVASSSIDNQYSSWTVKPYARKQDMLAMGRVTTLKIKYNNYGINGMPYCNEILNPIPAIIFSTGGYAGNHFHAFSDILLPLYFTTHQFNRAIHFLITDKYPGWISKYNLVLEQFSKYDVIDIDKENDQVFCFSRVIIGLRADKVEFTINDNYSMRNFTKLLRSAYSLQRESVLTNGVRPRMLIICRRKARHLVNKHAIADMAQTLGFDVVLKKIVWNVSIVARLVNSFDVMVGVHGAGLTNMIFLPQNAIVIQIIPFGLDFLARNCFQIPAQNMNLRYLDYKVNLNETSLLEKYSPTKINYTDPASINKKGFDDFRSVYLDNQDINLDLDRFRKTFLKALELLRI